MTSHTLARTKWGLIGLALALPPAMVAAAPGALSDVPLFVTSQVKHNLTLALDDSGSMDSEVLFATNDGALWWDSASNSFIQDNGKPAFEGDYKYVYLYPNGQNSTYDGSRLYADGSDRHYAIPPVAPYAFARSAAYNKAYYNPNETYEPWPSYGGFSFSDVTPSAAPFDPVINTDFTMDLTSAVDKSATAWTFRTQSGMACDNTGSTNCNTDEAITYYPATYYVRDTSASYDYDTSVTGEGIHPENAALFEAEAQTFEAPFEKRDDSNASGGSYIVAPSTEAMDTPPTDGNARFDFSMSGTVNIWIRRRMPGGDTDSFWMNLANHDQTEIEEDDSNSWETLNSESWYQWLNGHDHSDQWQWELWGTATLNRSDNTLNIRYRESGSGLDQVLITSNLTYTPGGAETLGEAPVGGVVTRDCATDPKPQHYRDFVDHPGAFTGVDAIGPDGGCLQRYEIRDDGTAFPSGRSYNQEIQNFANWFTYYRRRHQAMRGGVSAALEGVGGIRAGLFWFNDRRTVTMEDFDTASGRNNLLSDNFNHVDNGGTPLRAALDHAGKQYQRTGSGAPITQQCQKNFTLLFTDGYSNTGFTGIGNADSGKGSPYADSYSNTAADVAMHYFTENARPSMETGQVTTPSGCSAASPNPSLDCNADLHMNTYTVGLGARGTIFGQTHHTVADAYANPPQWPDVSTTRDRRQIDDFYHAAVNGRGQIFNADSPATLAEALKGALTGISGKIGTAASVTFNTGQLETGSTLYQSTFSSGNWSGTLFANSLDPQTGDVDTSATWEAAAALDARDLSSDPRTILTLGATDGVPFQWDSLTGAQQDDLRTNPAGSTDSVSVGQARLDYLRGDRSNEGSGHEFRVRGSRLGDIVHSTPVFVGEPEMNWPDAAPFPTGSESYGAYQKGPAASRTEVIYVGANDGMLHGFRASDGKEVLAYMPSNLFSTATQGGLHYLTDPGYKHRYYVDLSPTVADAYVKTDDTDTSAAWRTILIGGNRSGGKGYFALDVTDPSLFSNETANADELVMWEFSDADDPDLGHTYSQPVITRLNNDRWAAIFGDGYNDSGNGEAQLFIVYLDGGLDGSWSEGADYLKISTGAGSTSDRNGLASPAVIDLDDNGTADRVYAGDLQGNLWAFDLSASTPGSWDVAYGSGSGEDPLFQATAGGTAQPITTEPMVVKHPDINDSENPSNLPNVLVLFGTGQYMAQGDATSTETQTFYGVWDQGDSGLVTADLQEQTFRSGFSESRVLTDTTIDYEGTGGTQQFGWFIDLPSSGERVVAHPQVRGDIVYFNTTIPSTEACSFGGTGWQMSVKTVNGGTPDTEAPVFDLNDDGAIDGNDTVVDANDVEAAPAGQRFFHGIPAQSAFLSDHQYTPGSQTKGGQDIAERKIRGVESPQTGRVSWIELVPD